MFSHCSSVVHIEAKALPVDDPAMDDLEDDDALGAVFEEVGHLLLELGLHLVLGDHLQMVPGCLAAPLHLGQGLLQLVEVHLVGVGGGGGEVQILDHMLIYYLIGEAQTCILPKRPKVHFFIEQVGVRRLALAGGRLNSIPEPFIWESNNISGRLLLFN